MPTKDIRIDHAIPILRIFSEEAAVDFYVGYLGFSIDWEHRFKPELPLYLQVSRSGLVLHLSEHHGDGTPGTALWIAVDDVEGLQAELKGKRYHRMKPGIDRKAPGGPTMEVIDPFGNTLRFAQRT